MPLVTLNGLQRKQLREALSAVYQTEDRLTQFLNVKLEQRLALLSALHDNYPTKIDKVIENAEENNWLLNLIEKAKLDKPDDPRFGSLLDDLQLIALPNNIEPFDACCLSGEHIMIDRIQLRRALRNLCSPLGSRILLVNGSPRSGKSHSLQLLAYLQIILGGFELADVDLERRIQAIGLGSLINAEDLASFIIDKMDGYDGAIGTAPSDAQRARWIQQFCDRLEKFARTDRRQWWIVLDGFNKVPLPQSTIDLVKELAIRINRTLKTFRLVLIGYTDTFPTDVLPHVTEEDIPAVGNEELVEFFLKAFAERKIKYTGQDVHDAVTAVLSEVNTLQPGYFPALAITTYRELKKRLSN